jgi:hypothetical protein
MEPAREERDDGSRNLSRLTCKNRLWCERLVIAFLKATAIEVSRIEKRVVTCGRALPGIGLSTLALAEGTHTMIAPVDGSFSW